MFISFKILDWRSENSLIGFSYIILLPKVSVMISSASKANFCFKIELIYIVVQVQASEQLFPFLKFGWNLDFFQNSCMVTYLVSILVCCQNLGLIPIKLSICIKVLHTCVLNSRNVAFPAGWWRWRARVPAFIIDNVSSTNAMATGNCEPTKPDPERAEC